MTASPACSRSPESTVCITRGSFLPPAWNLAGSFVVWGCCRSAAGHGNSDAGERALGGGDRPVGVGSASVVESVGVDAPATIDIDIDVDMFICFWEGEAGDAGGI